MRMRSTVVLFAGAALALAGTGCGLLDPFEDGGYAITAGPYWFGLVVAADPVDGHHDGVPDGDGNMSVVPCDRGEHLSCRVVSNPANTAVFISHVGDGDQDGLEVRRWNAENSSFDDIGLAELWAADGITLKGIRFTTDSDESYTGCDDDMLVMDLPQEVCSDAIAWGKDAKGHWVVTVWPTNCRGKGE